MFLNIKDTGETINFGLKSYLEENYVSKGVLFDQVYVLVDMDTKYKEVEVVFPGLTQTTSNCVCVDKTIFNEDTINWLESL